MRIYQYSVANETTFLSVPKNSRILTIVTDAFRGCGEIWMEIDPGAAEELVVLRVIKPYNPVPNGGTYIGSFRSGDDNMRFVYLMNSNETSLRMTR